MKRILVIEDDDILRGLLKNALSREGFQVIEARDGLEGIRLYNEVPCELVMTDILMPEKEGLQTIRELLERNPDAIIIAMSGGGRQVGRDVLEIARRFGAAAVVQKPFDIVKLLELVKGLLEKGSTQPTER